ncbi:MAG: hypothetical protein H8E27_10930 [Verrucomicrobia subdivision 3 bacterium]|nr:hypothetical protein [Limisphaerales bacterium]
MTRLIFFPLFAVFISACVMPPRADTNLTPLVQANFQSTALPENWIVLNGEVTVTNGALQLPAKPLGLHGVMFGPALPDNLRVAARFQAKAEGRQLPEFGLGLNGIGGYRVMVSPGQMKLKLFRNDLPVHEVKHTWVPGDWTHIALQIQPMPGLKWSVNAKVWHSSELEPNDWQLAWMENVEPLPGRATVWGQPFSGKPIAVDDVRVWRID